MSRPAAILGGAGGVIMAAMCIATATYFGSKGVNIMIDSGKKIIFGMTGMKV